MAIDVAFPQLIRDAAQPFPFSFTVLQRVIDVPYIATRPNGSVAPVLLDFRARVGNNTHDLTEIIRVPNVKSFYADVAAPALTANRPPSPSITVKLYGKDNFTYISTPQTILGSRRWQDSVADLTEGSISVPYSTASEKSAAASITIGRHIRFYLDGRNVWTGKISSLDVVEVGPQSGDKVMTVICSDLRRNLETITVHPEKIDSVPSSSSRTFGWHSYDFNSSGWRNAVVRQAAISLSWQVPNTQPPWFYPWLPPDGWPTPGSNIIQSFSSYVLWEQDRTSYFVKKINLATDGLYDIWLAALSNADLFIDGILVYEGGTATDCWRTPWRALLELTAGDHVFAVKLRHVPQPSGQGLPGTLATIGREHCFAFCCHKVASPNTTLSNSTFLFGSDASWKCLDNPAVYPSTNLGQILTGSLFPEAFERGLLNPNNDSISFGDFTDSDGIAWPRLDDQTVEIGSTLLDFIMRLQSYGYELTVNPSGSVGMGGTRYNLYGGSRAGSDRTAGLTVGTNLVSVTRLTKNIPVNSLIVTYKNGSISVDDNAQIAANGRKESSLNLGSIEEESVARIIANNELVSLKLASTSISVSLEYAGDKPYTQFSAGDTVLLYKGTASEERVRIRTMDIAEDDVGNVQVTLEILSKTEDDYEKVAKMVMQNSIGTSDGSSTVATPVRLLAKGGTSGLVKRYSISSFGQGELVDVTEDVVQAQSTGEAFQVPVRLTYISIGVFGVLTSPLYVLLIKNGVAMQNGTLFLFPGNNQNIFLCDVDKTFQAGDSLQFMLYSKGTFDSNGGGLLSVNVWAAEASSAQLQPEPTRTFWQ